MSNFTNGVEKAASASTNFASKAEDVIARLAVRHGENPFKSMAGYGALGATIGALGGGEKNDEGKTVNRSVGAIRGTGAGVGAAGGGLAGMGAAILTSLGAMGAGSPIPAHPRLARAVLNKKFLFGLPTLATAVGGGLGYLATKKLGPKYTHEIHKQESEAAEKSQQKAE